MRDGRGHVSATAHTVLHMAMWVCVRAHTHTDIVTGMGGWGSPTRHGTFTFSEAVGEAESMEED